MPRFNLDDYISVQDRITRFWTEYPDGRIATRMMSHPSELEQVVFQAEAYKQVTDVQPSASGWATEAHGGGGANSTSWLENCETSAIGRALANLGYATSQKDRPSREEMRKVADDPDYEHGGNGYTQPNTLPDAQQVQREQAKTVEQPRSSNVHPDWKSHAWPEGKQLFTGRPVAMHARQNVDGKIVVTDTGVIKGDAITEPQGRRVFAMMKDYGYTDAIVHEMIAFCYGVNSTGLLTKREAGAVMDRMQYGSSVWSDPRQQALLLDTPPANTDTLAMLDELTAEQDAQDDLDAQLEATLGYDDGPEGFTPPYDQQQAEQDYAAFSALLADVKGPAGKKTSQALSMVRDWMRENGYSDNPRFQMALKVTIDRVNKGA